MEWLRSQDRACEKALWEKGVDVSQVKRDPRKKGADKNQIRRALWKILAERSR